MEHELARMISARRKALSITRAELSNISGISHRTIDSIERGEGNPTISVLMRLMKPLGLKLVADDRIKYV